MKTFAIQLPDGNYLRYTTSYIRLSPTANKNRHTTDEARFARHYKKEGSAKGIISSHLASRGREHNTYLEQKRHSESIIEPVKSWVTRGIERSKEAIEYIKQCTVVELEVETPNYKGNMNREIKFASYGIGFDTKKSMGNCHCRGCGIYFKDIPVMQFGKGSKPSRICPLCIIERAKDAQTILDNMKEERREEYEAERFSHRLG